MSMKRTNKREKNLNEPSFDLNKSSTGCAPCLKEALKIDRQINERPLNEIKIKEIKKIVRSIFQSSKYDIKKN
tara:strand:+ start:286 stop:504 length:219 start_codon:yes stop_codon:yes gene_type:complete